MTRNIPRLRSRRSGHRQRTLWWESAPLARVRHPLSESPGWTKVMQHTTSSGGTRIAYEEHGAGRPIILTAGALNAASTRPLAESFAKVGWRGVRWDRRGRSESGDSAPYSPQRQIDDLRAVIDAVGGDAVVFG